MWKPPAEGQQFEHEIQRRADPFALRPNQQAKRAMGRQAAFQQGRAVVQPAGLRQFLAHQPVELRGELRIGYARQRRSEEHTSELQSLMRISYAVFCLKKKTISL